MLVFPSSNLSIHPFWVENHKYFHSLKLLKKIGASKDFPLHPHKNSDIIKTSCGCSSIHMIFYSTHFLANRQSNIQEFSPGEIPEIFSLGVAPRKNIYADFSLIKSFHPSLMSEKPQTFSFSEAPKKIGASKDFPLHPHKNSDIIKTSWGYSPINMIFYSTKNSIVSRAIELRSAFRLSPTWNALGHERRIKCGSYIA